jgi:DNA-binding GntR family transcriptional regulator
MLVQTIKKLNFKPVVLGEQVSRVLMGAIIANELGGGEQLLELELQKQFGISRSPLREAFRELEKVGLVEIIPRKGTFVKRISRREIVENYIVRMPLEALAAKEAYNKMNEKDLEAMRRILLNMEKATQKNSAKSYWKHHREFHDTFINASDVRTLIDILKKLRIHSVRHRFCYPVIDENLEETLNYHQKIFQLFRSQDTDQKHLENLVIEHMESAFEKFLSNYDNIVNQENIKSKKPSSRTQSS